MSESGEPVYLYVYDLSQVSSFIPFMHIDHTAIDAARFHNDQGMARIMSRQMTGTQIDGIWHTAIVVYGIEYYYGQGISTAIPPVKSSYLTFSPTTRIHHQCIVTIRREQRIMEHHSKGSI